MMVDLRQSPQYGNYLEELGWQVEKVDNCQAFIKKIPFLGSFIKIQRPEQIPFLQIEKLAQKYRAFAVYLEPSLINHYSSIITHGYRPTNSPYLPSKTIHLDLTQSEKRLLAQMKKDARYSIGKAKKEAIQIIGAADLKKFHHAWRKSIGWRRYVPSLKNLKSLKGSFGKRAIFLAAITGKPSTKILAGCVILTTNEIAYYFYAFTLNEGRKKFAQYALVWEAIKLAKKQGCRVFDFEGIYDPRFPNKSWRGFTHFKKSFGGKEVEYPGSFNKYFNSLAKVFLRFF